MINRLTPLLAIAALVSTTGCATKKYVRQTVDPINTQVSELDKRATENAGAVKDLDEKTQRNIARVDERAGSADAKAAAADQKATEAGSQATQAMDKATSAHSIAETGVAKAGQLERTVENLDNFQMATTKTVYFNFDKSTLKDEDKQILDELANSLSDKRRYVVEVQGYTDGTGPNEYNYTLSGRRADAVVRYLTMHHKLPVYRIHTLAVGKDAPIEPNKTREGRKQNRRVDIRVYVPKAEGTTQTASTKE